MAFKKLSVSDFGGKTLSASFSSTTMVNPKIAEAQELKTWFDNGGSDATRKGLSTSAGAGRDTFENRKFISSVKEESLGYNEKADWINVKTTINFIKTDKEGGPWYCACINKAEPCNQRCKVTPTSDGQYQCDKCGQQVRGISFDFFGDGDGALTRAAHTLALVYSEHRVQAPLHPQPHGHGPHLNELV